MLIKHSSVESGIRWWFLHDARFDGISAEELSKISYDDLRQAKACMLVKRFESEAELDMEAAVKYGVTPMAVPAGRFDVICSPVPPANGQNIKVL